MTRLKKLFQKDFKIIKEKCDRQHLTISAIIGLVLLIMLIFDLHCPIQIITGISCPGCGMTRAYIHLAKMDFGGAFFFHPLWWLLPFFPPVFMAYQRKNISHKTYQHFLTVFAFCFILVYLCRLIWFRSSVLQFQPQKGLIYRLFSF